VVHDYVDGFAAVRAFGLDPATATVDDVNRVFRQRAKRHHPDQGGGGVDMGKLVRSRDAARDYVNARA
jgi:hypothetical protein